MCDTKNFVLCSLSKIHFGRI